MLPVALLNQKGMSCFPVGRPSEQWTEEGNLMYFTDSFIEISQISLCQRGADTPVRIQLPDFHIEKQTVPIHPSHTAAASHCFHYVLFSLDWLFGQRKVRRWQQMSFTVSSGRVLKCFVWQRAKNSKEIQLNSILNFNSVSQQWKGKRKRIKHTR